MNSSFRYKTDSNVNNYNLLNSRNNNNTYEQIKRGKPNSVESYLNSFKYRYAKKGGLKKLDCYYEKKLFSSFVKLEKLAKQKNISKERITRIIYKKYVLGFFLLSLLPVLSFAFPDIIIWEKYSRKFKITCMIDGRRDTTIKEVLVPIPTTYKTLRYIFLIISFLIVVSFIIYTYIKVMKYKRIKSGILK
ncbi:hypothetical protein PVIIG_05371 [Plasmodium vivax India VII]|uniref:Uncharacterized protein n=1 Tax=Plasmodium vivax India VII TaxID=1077284 RepID=A0A0J9S4N2_PLAVI|nr:hypothetical protein PVIIG_05371 [Plasmodium vivax India VII]